jgi:hypothetical protein
LRPPVEKGSRRVHRFINVLDDLLCIRLVFSGVGRENTNTEFPVLD